jgi:hypothetical protein
MSDDNKKYEELFVDEDGFVWLGETRFRELTLGRIGAVFDLEHQTDWMHRAKQVIMSITPKNHDNIGNSSEGEMIWFEVTINGVPAIFSYSAERYKAYGIRLSIRLNPELTSRHLNAPKTWHAAKARQKHLHERRKALMAELCRISEEEGVLHSHFDLTLNEKDVK